MNDTSSAAHAAIQSAVPAIVEEVLIALTLGDLTTPELVGLTGISSAALQPRTSELRKAGKIADSGKRRVNPETGKKSIVWTLQ